MKWFKHMVDARRDLFVQGLMDTFGLDGYAMWFLLLEIIAEESKPNQIIPSATLPEPTWCRSLRVRRQKFRSFLRVVEQLRKISSEKSNNLITVKCLKLAEIRDDWSNRQIRNSGVTPESLSSTQNDPVFEGESVQSPPPYNPPPLIEKTEGREEREVQKNIVEEIFDLYCLVHSKNSGFQLNEPRRKMIRNALKQNSVREVQEAIWGARLSAFHMGVNDRNKKYNGLDVILRQKPDRDNIASLGMDFQDWIAKNELDSDYSPHHEELRYPGEGEQSAIDYTKPPQEGGY